MITKDDIQFYKKYQEWYHYEFYKQRHQIHKKHTHEITDVVQISTDITHDIGYAGQIGVVVGLSTSGHVYVLAYDSRNDRYWVCGFDERHLTKRSRKYNELAHIEPYNELYKEFINYLTKNQFELSTAAFKEAWETFKNNKGQNNLIHIDFKRRRQ